MDEEMKSIKHNKEHWDQVIAVCNAQYGIPKLCPCGKTIRNSVDEEDSYDYLPGKRYFICTEYENDGLHFRQPWVSGVEDEIERLTKQMQEKDKLIRDCMEELQRLKMRVSDLEMVLL